MTRAQEEKIDELEEENKRLERVRSRDKIKIKRLTEQLSRRAESEDEVRKLKRENKALYKQFEKRGERNKTLEERVSDKEDQLKLSEKQNAKLRNIVEMLRASSPVPSYDALRQAPN